MKMIIADDERMAVLGMVSILRELYGQDLTLLEAANGAQLVSQVREQRPDIAFIDIRMPVMDGLTALTQVRRDSVETQCIMLSGYAEFDYARQALSLGAVDYLLKPVSAGELEKAVGRAMQNLAGQRKARDTAFSSRLLQQLCCRTQEVDDAQAPDGSIFEVYQLYFDHAQTEDALARSAELLAKSVETEAPGLRAVCRPFPGVVSLFESVRPENALCRRGLLERFAKEWSAHALYARADTLYAIVESAYRLQDASALRVLRWEEYLTEWPQTSADEESAARAAQALGQSLADQDFDLFQSSFALLCGGAGTDQWTSREYQSISSYLGLAPAESLSGLKENVMARADAVFRQGKSKRSDEVTVEKVMEYLQAHFSQSDIGVDTIAHDVGITPNYLSSIFRKITGDGLNEYLTRMRIDHARQLLTGQPAMRISDVAQATGYTNTRYFSRVFLNKTGMLPSVFADLAAKKAL